MREKEILPKSKSLILNLQCMCFMDLTYKFEHYERIKEEFFDSDEKFSSFLNYFDLTLIKGQYFSVSDWNYHKAMTVEGSNIEFSKKYHLTNNAAESCNAILNSCLNRGKITFFYFFCTTLLSKKGKLA